MKTQPIVNWKIIATVALVTSGAVGTGCTQKETDAILSGVQVVANELGNNSNNNDVTFRDWLSSQLDN